MTTRHILIIDDEPTVASFLSEKLRHSKWDCRISVAHSGKEALETLDHCSVDLLVVNMRTPGIDGLELICQARASSPQTRTILITIYGDGEAEMEAHHVEVCRTITEPLDVLDFTWAMQEALRDVAISRPGLAVLSDESLGAIARQLEYLRRDIGARSILLADMSGQQLIKVGSVPGLDGAALLSALSRGFATADALARQVGDGGAAHLTFHKGTHYEVYTTNVGNGLFLAMVYDVRIQASRIGIVWLHSQRAVKRLLSVLSTASPSETPHPPEAGFGSSLTAELDTLLTEAPLSGPACDKSEPDAAPADAPTSGGAVSKIHSNADVPEGERLDLGAAIAQELASVDPGVEPAEPRDDWQETSRSHQA
jgi:DNA-binding response OmpR family regulator